MQECLVTMGVSIESRGKGVLRGTVCHTKGLKGREKLPFKNWKRYLLSEIVYS